MSDGSTSRDALPLSPTSPFARRSSDRSSSQYHGPRKEPDVSLVKFLIDYARDTECPPLFKVFLEDVVLRDGTGDLLHRIEFYFQNPEIKGYQLSPRFWRELESYTIYEQMMHPTDTPVHVTTPPSAPISEQYRPNSQLTPIHSINLGSVVEPVKCSSDQALMKN
ncbi:hypothetical protein N657DRAFT_677056 [Parathielavia appendiculata]|uniref:Uncharacterized protein n=1 Tax=Parathielavia appendiculata TaxID=2587402 RepID=A0AAN6UAG6_9PEZI|nr:hypothetical protein N657DRAFT_677056 [Parathielavia appendiculata]